MEHTTMIFQRNLDLHKKKKEHSTNFWLRFGKQRVYPIEMGLPQGPVSILGSQGTTFLSFFVQMDR